MFILTDQYGCTFQSEVPGKFGGHQIYKTYGKLDCSAALRAIRAGSYAKHRVFFADENAARGAGYRPCGRCMPLEFAQGRQAREISTPVVCSAERISASEATHEQAQASGLGRDNIHLSEARNQPKQADLEQAYPANVAALVIESHSDNTRRAYAGDLCHFLAWGGKLPTTPERLAAYLAQYSEELSVATLSRRVASITRAQEAQGGSSPATAEIVKATLRGIKRRHGLRQRQAAPLMQDQLIRILDTLGDQPKDVRDRALLLIGFAGAFRRSELVGLDAEDVEFVRQGVIFNLRRSKTDQFMAGRKVAVPFSRSQYCPVLALKDWLTAADISAGPLFKRVDRHGIIGAHRLSNEAVSLIVKQAVKRMGLDPISYSGHSLRAGFATSAARAGVSSIKIRAQTGHASDAMLSRYVRDGELFVGHALYDLL